RVLGIDDRVGSIAPGKDADFIVTDGPLLDFYTQVHWTVINGRIVYDKAEESLFGHIRPRTPTTQPAPYKFWPRPFNPRPAAARHCVRSATRGPLRRSGFTMPRRSPLLKMRISATPYFIMASRVRPRPKANPVYSCGSMPPWRRTLGCTMPQGRISTQPLRLH